MIFHWVFVCHRYFSPVSMLVVKKHFQRTNESCECVPTTHTGNNLRGGRNDLDCISYDRIEWLLKLNRKIQILNKNVNFSLLLNQFSPSIEVTHIQIDSVTFTPKLQTWCWQLTKTVWRENMCVRFPPSQTPLTIESTAHRRGWRATKYVIEKASKLVSHGAELHQRAPAAGWERSGRTY